MLKRRIVGLAAVTVMAVSSIAPVIASEGQADVSVNGGSVNLDELDERNPAAIENVGGGKWEYGVGPVNVYSNYNHDSKSHSAMVKGIVEDRDSQLAGTPAKASTIKNPLGGNIAKWNAW